MRKLLVFLLILLMIAFVVYRQYGKKEESFRHDAPLLRAKASLENPYIDLAVIGPEEESEKVILGVEMAVIEANNHRNPDSSTGLKILVSHENLVTKKIRSHYFTHNSKEEALELSRKISRQYEFTAVIGHYVSDVTYPSALNYHQAGLMHIVPFSTSTRITSHNWPNAIRVLPSVKAIMSAIPENISYLFDQKQEVIRLAVFNIDSIYGEDALTALHNYIVEIKRLVSILNNTEKMIAEKRLSPDISVYEWLSIDFENEEPTMDEIDTSDKIIICKQLVDFGFANPGIRSVELDIDRMQSIGHSIFSDTLTVSSAIESLRKLAPRLEVVYSNQYRQGTMEFSSKMRKLSQSNADIILILDYMNNTFAELLSKIRESGNTQPILGDDGLEFPNDIMKILGDRAGDIYIVSSYDDQKHGSYLTQKLEELSDFFPSKEIEDFRPNYLTYQGYRATSLFAQAITNSQSSDPAILASRIKNSNDQGWLSQSGNPLQFDGRGDIMNPKFLLKKYSNGMFQVIK